MNHCGSPAGSLDGKPLDPGVLCLLRQVEQTSKVDHGESPEMKICSKWSLQRVLSALRIKQGARFHPGLQMTETRYYLGVMPSLILSLGPGCVYLLLSCWAECAVGWPATAPRSE